MQDKWKLIAYASGEQQRQFPPQLFDLEADPWEMHNVAPANEAIVARLDAVLRECLRGDH